MGTEVYAYTVQAPACESVRARRDLIAEMIDETASVVDRPKVLSVACGHLREAGKSQALREHRIGDFLALDHDTDARGGGAIGNSAGGGQNIKKNGGGRGTGAG